MANYRIGDVIRLTRKALEISQEELSDGICSVETLSRIENNKHAVKRDTYEKLMQKMQRNPFRNYAVGLGVNGELLDERKQLEEAVAKFQYEEADIFLKLLKEKMADTLDNQQYMIRMESTLEYRRKRIDVKEWECRLQHALSVTVAEYEKYLDIESDYPYTELEIYIWMNLAMAARVQKDYARSEKIYDMLQRCIQLNYMDQYSTVKLEAVVEYNHITLLEEIGEYQAAIEKAEQVLQLAIKHDLGSLIPPVLGIRSWIKAEMLEKEQKTDIREENKLKHSLKQAYYIAIARSDNVNAEIIKKHYYENFGQLI